MQTPLPSLRGWGLMRAWPMSTSVRCIPSQYRTRWTGEACAARLIPAWLMGNDLEKRRARGHLGIPASVATGRQVGFASRRADAMGTRFTVVPRSGEATFGHSSTPSGKECLRANCRWPTVARYETLLEGVPGMWRIE